MTSEREVSSPKLGMDTVLSMEREEDGAKVHCAVSESNRTGFCKIR